MTCSRAQAAKHMREVLKMNDIKIKVKKSELEYCFKADILYQRFINEQLKKSIVNNIYGYIDTDLAYAKHKQKVSSIYGVCAKRAITNEIH